MNLTMIIIIILSVGVAFLLIYFIRNVIIPTWVRKSMNKLSKDNIYKTMRAAKTAIVRDPQNAEAHYLLGKAYLADNREEQAFREYRSASRLGIQGKNIPETEFRETIAYLYGKFKEEEEALKEYVLLIKSHPENPEYYFRAGKLFSGRSREDLAEQYLHKAVELNPKEGIYHSELALNYYHSKRTKDAAVEFEAALQLDPADGHALLYLGKIHKDAKDFDGAVPYLEKASRDQEYKLRALVELGSCYMSLRMIEKAVPELERAVNCIEKEDEPDSLYARYFLAMCYERKNEYANALAQWDRIYAQKKNFRDVNEKRTKYMNYRQESPETPAGKS